MARGYYTRTVLAAWDWRDGKLTQRWTFDSDAGPEATARTAARATTTSASPTSTATAATRSSTARRRSTTTARGLYSTGLGHGDALHVSDLDPDRPGLEVFNIQERFGDAGANFRDARTGEVLWRKASIRAGDDGEGPVAATRSTSTRARAAPRAGSRARGCAGIWNAKGEQISDNAAAPP